METHTLLAFVLCVGVVAGEWCAVSNLAIRCDMRCDGSNKTDLSGTGSSNPPAGQLLSPSAGMANFAQVDGGSFPQLLNQEPSQGVRKMPAPALAPGGVPLVFLEEQSSNDVVELIADSGSPTVISTISDSDISNETAYAPVHSALNAEQLSAHIGDVSRIEWANVRKASFSCRDGRYTNGVLGTAGGDFGEFLLALNVYEHMLSKQLSQAEVTKAFIDYLGVSPKEKFAMCTDQNAVDQLAKAVGTSNLDMAMPAEEFRTSLKLRVLSPEFVGCNHIKFMLMNPDQYSVRKGLVENLIRTFFDIYWNEWHPMRPRLDLQVLQGDHVERAVVKVKTIDWCLKKQGLAPLIASKTKATSVFLSNPDAVKVFRDDLATFFSRHQDPPANKAEMAERLRTLGEGQSHLTSRAVSGMLRTFTVTLK